MSQLTYEASDWLSTTCRDGYMTVDWRARTRKTPMRVLKNYPLNMLNGVVFLLSKFLELNSDDFPFFKT